MNYFDTLSGRAAIVTGSASGLGAAMARAFAQAGINVIVSDIQDEKGEKVVKEITSAGGKAVYHHCDVRVTEDVKTIWETELHG
mgnify:FL=1